ncbi:MAG TPA: ATP-binding protein [Solirubrobacteraceae bacterium]|jgi:anti-sigma regulatory factor (Ser/Thr protein kinase)|nr:ATP-binding protein [Solirubrobacteraceae bacterium]
MPVRKGPDDASALCLQLASGRDAPAGARAAIADFSARHGLHADTLATMMLLVSELVTNAVVHPEVQKPSDIGLRAHLADGTIRVEITDQGSGFTPQERDPARLDGGYGLFLLDRAAARWGVEHDQGTTVWFEVSAQTA